MTAPQAAIPPAINDLIFGTFFSFSVDAVVFQGSPCGGRHCARRRTEGSGFDFRRPRLLNSFLGTFQCQIHRGSFGNISVAKDFADIEYSQTPAALCCAELPEVEVGKFPNILKNKVLTLI